MIAESINTLPLFSFHGVTAELTVFKSGAFSPSHIRIGSSASGRDGNTIVSTFNIYDLSRSDLGNLADQLQLAAIQIRDLLSLSDEGRRFERDQAIAFGVDRLEGDLPLGAEVTD